MSGATKWADLTPGGNVAEFDHWLPLHVGDYLADTMHLTTLQHGIYIRLIMHYWKRRELPDDDRVLAQIAGLTFRHWQQVGGAVRALFTYTESKGQTRLAHARLDSEISKAKTLSEMRKALGKKGAAARWEYQLPSEKNGKSNATRARPYPTGKSNPPTEDYSSLQPQAATERVVRLDGARAQPRPTEDEIRQRIQQDLRS